MPPAHTPHQNEAATTLFDAMTSLILHNTPKAVFTSDLPLQSKIVPVAFALQLCLGVPLR